MSNLLEEEDPETRPEDETDPRAKTKYCPDCGAGPFTLSELGNHSKACPEAIARREKEKKIKASLQEEAGAEPEEEEESPYITEHDPSSILRQILTKHPGIKEAVLNEVMEWAELYGVLQPTQLPYILTSLGVKHATAALVTQKYSLAMQRAQANIMPYGAQSMAFPTGFNASTVQPNMFPMMMPQIPTPQQQVPQQVIMTPYGPMYGPTMRARDRYDDDKSDKRYATVEDLQKMREDMRKRSEMDELKDDMKELRDLITRSGGGQNTTPAGYIEERVPIDEKGNIVHPNDAVSVRYVRRPVQQGTYPAYPGTQDNFIVQKLNDLEKRLSDEKYDSLKKEIEGLRGKPEDSPYVKELKQKLDTSLSKVDALSEKLDDQEKAQLYGALDDLRKRLDAVGQGEYKEDTMRLIGTGLNKVADIIERKSPLRELGDIFFPQTRIEPPSQDIVVQPGGGNKRVQDKLAQVGLTTTIQQQPY